MANESLKKLVEELINNSHIIRGKNHALRAGTEYKITYKKAYGNPLDENAVDVSLKNLERERDLLRQKTAEIIADCVKKNGFGLKFQTRYPSKQDIQNGYMLLLQDVPDDVIKNRLKNHDIPQNTFVLLLSGEDIGKAMEYEKAVKKYKFIVEE